MIDLVREVYKMFPTLKKELLAAHMKISPHDFVSKTLKMSFFAAVAFSILSFLFFQRMGIPVFFVIFVFGIIFMFVMSLQMKVPAIAIKKRAKEIDNEVLFAARFLLIKLNSGKPLFNALIDTSQSYGVASKYFKEIVDDINFGTPIEDAINSAIDTSTSRYFKKVLFQIGNSLKIGVDVTKNLAIVIQEIEEEQALEIERYSKKLSSVALFYMLLAIVVPSLGLTIFIVLASMINIPLNLMTYGAMIMFIFIVQVFFMNVFKQIRPAVNF